jgi:predicted small secreted protein
MKKALLVLASLGFLALSLTGCPPTTTSTASSTGH